MAKAERDLGNVELIIGTSKSNEETAALLKEAGPKTPVLAINLQIFTLTRVVTPILEGGHPMIAFSLAGERSRLDVCPPLATSGPPRHPLPDK